MALWPDRQRGEFCLIDIESIDSLMVNSPMIQRKDDIQINIKSSMIREETLQAFVILTIIVESSDQEEDEERRKDEGIPIKLWRSFDLNPIRQ